MRQTGSYTWLFQRVSGALLFVLIAVHFVLTHYMGFEKRMYAQVVQRLNNPLWKTFDLLILSLALYHGLYGVWSIINDHIEKDILRIVCLVAIVTVGTVLFTLGVVTILTIN